MASGFRAPRKCAEIFSDSNPTRATTADLFWTDEKPSAEHAPLTNRSTPFEKLFRQQSRNGEGFDVQFGNVLLQQMAGACGAALTRRLDATVRRTHNEMLPSAEPSVPLQQIPPADGTVAVSMDQYSMEDTLRSVAELRDSVISNPLYRRVKAPVQCRLSTSKAALLISAFVECYKGSQLNKETICLLISTLAPPNTRQLTVKDLDKYMATLVPPETVQATFHCSKCRKRVQNEATTCTNCDRKKLGYPGPDIRLKHIQVVWVNLGSQLDRIVRCNHCIMRKHMGRGKADELSDIRDGSIMKQVEYNRAQTGALEFDLTLILMSDGGANTKLGGGKLWPLNLYVGELPQKMRESFSNTVLACLVLCYQEPPAEQLVAELLRRMVDIGPREVLTKCCNKTVTYSGDVRVFSGDLLCRQTFLNLVGIGGQDSCAFCISANRKDEKLQARLFESPKQWEMRTKELLDFIDKEISTGAELPFLGLRGVPTFLKHLDAVSVEGLHAEVSMCQLMCHLVFGTNYTTFLKNSCPAFRLDSRSDKAGKREYSRFIQLTRFPAHLSNKFKLRGILDSTHYSRTEVFWVTTVTLIPFVFQYLPQKGREDGSGLNCYYFAYLFMLCLRKLSVSKLRKPDLIYIDAILKLLYERADFYLGSNARGLRFHTFMCHSIENTRKLGQIMNHSSAAMEQSLHFLKTKLELVTKTYAEHALLHVLRSRAAWEAVGELHETTEDTLVKDLCEHIMALAPGTRQVLFPESSKGFEKTADLGKVTVSRAKVKLESHSAEHLRISVIEMFGEQVLQNIDYLETHEMATFSSAEAEEKLSVRVWTTDEIKRNSQRSVLEYKDASDIRRFIRVLSFVFLKEKMYIFGDRMVTQSLLAGLEDPTDPALLKARTLAPPGFYRDFWFEVQKEKSEIIESDQVVGFAAVMQTVKCREWGAGQDPTYVVSCDSCFTAF